MSDKCKGCSYFHGACTLLGTCPRREYPILNDTELSIMFKKDIEIKSSDKDYSGCCWAFVEADNYNNIICNNIQLEEEDCKDNPNCYYKQLQACQEQVNTKTDECEKLKAKNKRQRKSHKDNIYRLHKAYESICEKYKSQNTALKQQLDITVEFLKAILS